MPLGTVVLPEQAIRDAADERKIEWEANIREFLALEKGPILDQASELHIEVTEQQYRFELKDERGSTILSKSMPQEVLAQHVMEYVDVVRQLARAQGLNQLEALDMAKKVTHDRAGRALRRALPDFDIDHVAARGLFTLLFSLRIDTTRLTGIHGHRTIR